MKKVACQTLPWVNSLKGIAILMVVIVHSTHRFNLPFLVNQMCNFGQMGCQIFFVISAFCISMSYDRHRESVGRFYKRRFISIAPGYWITILLNIITILITIAVFGYSRRWGTFTFGNVSLNFLLLNGFSIGGANNFIVRGGWYVGTTIILYSLFPMMIKLYYRLKRYRVCFPFIIFFVVFVLLYFAGSYTKTLYCTNFSFIYYSFINQLPCYTLGILLYDLYKRDEIRRIKAPVFGAVLSLIVALAFFYIDIPYAFVFEPFVFGLSIFFSICWLINQQRKDYSKFSSFLQKWGGVSYSVYLIHTLVVYDAARLLTKFVPDNVFVWLIWLPIAFILLWLITSPYNKLINTIQKKITM